jgi:hypothetical protein
MTQIVSSPGRRQAPDSVAACHPYAIDPLRAQGALGKANEWWVSVSLHFPKSRISTMLKSTCHRHHAEQAADVLIPIIRAAATIGFAVAPCSLGFVIIAVSEQFIRSIMVGEDPEMLVSDLQKQFPEAALAAADQDKQLVAQVVSYIDRSEQVPELPFDGSAPFASA